MAKAALREKTKPVSKKQEDILRLVINEKGRFLYMSDSLRRFFGKKSVGALHINDVLEFEDADEAYYVHSRLNMAEKTKPADDFTFIRPGCHIVRFKNGKRRSARKDFQFDWVNTPDNKTYLVATNDMMGELPETSDALKRLIFQISDLQDNFNKKNDSALFPDTKARLRHNESALFMEMSTELQSVIEPGGQFIRFNKNFAKILGYKDENLLGKGLADLVHGDDQARLRNALFTISGSGARADYAPALSLELRLIGASGGVFYIDWQLKNVEGVIYALGRDITDIKTNEATLKKKEGQLKEAQALADMGHWHWEIGSDKITWSDELYRIFGKEPHNFKPSIDGLRSFLYRRDVGRVIQAFQRAIIEKRNYDIDFRFYREDGQTRYIRCEGRCEFDGNGEVAALFGIMQDVTERLQHERDLQEAKEAAEAAYAVKSRFLANMSHELRTPLNAIIGFSEMMQRQLLGPLGNEKYLDYMTGIRESGEHLLDLISDILDMAKIEAGKYELDLEDINVSKLGRLAVHMMEGRAVDAKIKLAVNVDQEDQSIVADRRALMQILLNLLSNAIKFTGEGGSVTLNIFSENSDFIKFQVVDTGIGIPQHKINCITKPFEQVETGYARQHEGSGLGLSITKDLTELHSGSLAIESELGKGTIVTVSLPQNGYQGD